MPGYSNKRKRMSEADVDQLTEHIRRKVTQDILANIPNILASHGLKIVAAGASPNRSPSDARRTSFSSIEGGGHRFQNDVHEPMLQLEEQQQNVQTDDQQHQMIPNLSAGSISLLKEPTPCSLLGHLGGYPMEVARGEIIPDRRMLHNVEVPQDYVVVHVQFVHSAHQDYILEVPPNDEITTLKDALLQWVQWKKTSIVLHPGPMEPTQGPSPPKPPMPPRKPNTLAAPHNVEATKKAEAPPPVDSQKPAQKAADSTGSKKAKSDQGSLKSTEKKPASTGSEWTQANKYYMLGKPLMTDAELKKAGPYAQKLHRWYMSSCEHRKREVYVSFKAEHFQSDDAIFPIDFADLYDLYNIDALDCSIMRVFSL